MSNYSKEFEPLNAQEKLISNQNIIKKNKEDWFPIIPVPDTANNPDYKHFNHGRPKDNYIWEYKDENGKLSHYKCRFDLSSNKKVFAFYTFCKSSESGKTEWRWKGPKEWKLYNLYEILSTPNKSILIVEGEKCCDIARKFPFISSKYVFTTSGGCSSHNKTDWTPVKNRKVII